VHSQGRYSKCHRHRGDRRRLAISKATAVGDVAGQHLLIAIVLDSFVDREAPAGPDASVSAANDVSSTFLYVVVPEMRPDGPRALQARPFEGPAAEEVLRKIERRRDVAGRVGRPRSGICPLGIGWVWANGAAAVMIRSAAVTTNRGVIAASISEDVAGTVDAPAMFRLPTPKDSLANPRFRTAVAALADRAR
jgi:hypothetical protein